MQENGDYNPQQWHANGQAFSAAGSGKWVLVDFIFRNFLLLQSVNLIAIFHFFFSEF